MKNSVKTITKTLVVTTSLVASYKIGEMAEAHLNEKGAASEEEAAATLVAVTATGFGIGLVARAICKKIG